MISFVLVNTFVGCSKKDDTPQPYKFPVPVWMKDASGKYPLSMTAVVRLSYKLNLNLQPNDQLAAFINGECRGTGVMVKAGLANVFNIVIQGTSTENSKVTFKYYSNFNQNMFLTTDFLAFTVDRSFGSPDNPETLPLVIIQ